MTDGMIDGSTDGLPEGINEGFSDGVDEGVLESVTDGAIEGTTEDYILSFTQLSNLFFTLNNLSNNCSVKIENGCVRLPRFQRLL